jgi:hypothetical protein
LFPSYSKDDGWLFLGIFIYAALGRKLGYRNDIGQGKQKGFNLIALFFDI